MEYYLTIKKRMLDMMVHSLNIVLVGQAPVAHAYNPSYSGSRDQDCGSKPAQENPP
jgi:hypothetical protein